MTHLNHVRKYYLPDNFSIILSSYIHLSGCLTNDHVCILRWPVEALRARFRWNRDQSPELIFLVAIVVIVVAMHQDLLAIVGYATTLSGTGTHYHNVEC